MYSAAPEHDALVNVTHRSLHPTAVLPQPQRLHQLAVATFLQKRRCAFPAEAKL